MNATFSPDEAQRLSDRNLSRRIPRYRRTARALSETAPAQPTRRIFDHVRRDLLETLDALETEAARRGLHVE